MVKSTNTKDYIEHARENIKNEQFDITTENKEKLVLFFSFDLENSTDFKVRNRNKWPLVFNHFFEAITTKFQTQFSDIKVWKYLGDEVLFYLYPKSTTEITNSIHIAFQLLSSVIESLNNQHKEVDGKLSLKGTVWSADINVIKPQEIQKAGDTYEYNNISFRLPESDTRAELDFIGTDVDIGFRLAKHSFRNLLSISSDLIYFLYKQEPTSTDLDSFLNNCKLINYKQLKGVWKDRAYPIIWYHEDWANINKIFNYDEHLKTPEIDFIRSGQFKIISELNKVYDELDKTNIINRYSELVNSNCQLNEKQRDIYEMVPTSKLAEVHCAAIVINAKKQILIAQRPHDKKRLPNIWEFGCGQIHSSSGFEESLKDSYKEDFGIDIEILNKNTPIATYELQDKEQNRVIPGLIFVAVFSGTPTDLHPIKHQEYKWVDFREIDQLDSTELVPNGIENMKKAMIIYNQHYSNLSKK